MPGEKCEGTTGFLSLPLNTSISSLKCGIIGDERGVRVKLEPENKTKEVLKRLGGKK